MISRDVRVDEVKERGERNQDRYECEAVLADEEHDGADETENDDGEQSVRDEQSPERNRHQETFRDAGPGADVGNVL